MIVNDDLIVHVVYRFPAISTTDFTLVYPFYPYMLYAGNAQFGAWPIKIYDVMRGKLLHKNRERSEDGHWTGWLHKLARWDSVKLIISLASFLRFHFQKSRQSREEKTEPSEPELNANEMRLWSIRLPIRVKIIIPQLINTKSRFAR